MSVAIQKPMTLEQFLVWEARQEARHEFDGTQPWAMAGGTASHAAIQVNLVTALRNHLRGKPCRPFGSQLKVAVAGRIRYPDAFVVCTPVPPRDKVVGDPTVVFEILSDDSANDELVVKNGEYRDTVSVRRYVVLQQTHAGAVVFARKGEDWVTELVSGAAAMLRMPEIGIEIALSELYADVDLDAAG